jgi:invasion protein IalB
MHKFISAAAIALALSLVHAPASAATASTDAKPSEARTAQQGRMKTCSVDAKQKELKGPERKAFMSECLKKKA